jgi:outer membrane usher protein
LFSHRGSTALLAVFCLVSAGPADADESVVARVALNTEDQGEFFLIFTSDGDVLFPLQDLQEMGIVSITGLVEKEGKQYVSLKALAPDVKYRFDEKTVTLEVTVLANLLAPKVQDFRYRPSSKLVRSTDKSAFLNYSLIGTNSNSLQGLSEIGLHADNLLGLSTFSYTKSTTQDQFLRLLSSVSYDDAAAQRRFILGDANAFSGVLGGVVIAGGLTISKNFELTPYFLSVPGLDVTGILQTPSEVEIYQRGQLVRRERLGPGPFSLLNLPSTTGAGEATLVIRDAFQREQRLVVPYYLSSLLLRPGLQEYNYTVGYRRLDLGQKSFHYQDPVIVAFHRFGFSKNLTGGLRGEADKNLINAGPLATFLLGEFGEVDSGLAGSYDRGQIGYGAYASYFYAQPSFSVRLSARGFSRDYFNLSLTQVQGKTQFEWIAGLGYNLRLLGSISANYTSTDFYAQPRSRQVSVFFSRPIFFNWFLQVSAIRSLEPIRSTELFAGIVLFLGAEHSGSVGVTKQEKTVTETATVQKNPPRGPGLAYRLQASGIQDQQTGTRFDTDDLVQYQGDHAVYGVGYRRIAGEDTYDLRLAGAIALIDRGVYFTRPIFDSFALVKVENLENVRVQYNNQVEGRTNAKGELLVPDLLSYYDNKLAIEDTDIPINYQLPVLQKFVVPGHRGGSVIKFNAIKLQGFVGHLYVTDKGVKRTADYGELTVSLPGNKDVTGVVGKEGEFYLENLPSGTLPAHIVLKDEICLFDLTIPKTDEPLVDLGMVTCETH